MGIVVYGRRAIRAAERATGARIVHAAGPWLTTVAHQHYELHQGGPGWVPIPWVSSTHCSLWLASCTYLFGADEGGAPLYFMRGACRTCDAGPGDLHRWDCPTLLDLLTWPSINPDYWPKPVHRPLWVDDPRAAGQVM